MSRALDLLIALTAVVALVAAGIVIFRVASLVLDFAASVGSQIAGVFA